MIHRGSMLVLSLLVASCGAKTGLLVPEAGESMDASIDASRFDSSVRDADMDAPDALDAHDALDARCPDTPVPLRRTDVETVLVMDGSGSMSTTWDGLPFGVGLPSRWMIVRDTLAAVLPPFDSQLALGAKVFPNGPECEVAPGLDVRPHLGASAEVLALFDRWRPEGGTPTAEALRTTLRALDDGSDAVRVIVAAMDGGPNCNPDPGVPPDMCICTGPRRWCLGPDGASICLDAAATLEVVRESAEERGTPVVIVGIDDPTRPDLSDFLDEMAIAGGWPRPEGSDRRFYIAREPDDLRVAFGEIVELVSRCVFVATVTPPEDATIVVRVAGREVAQDPDHIDGWDWTDRSAGAVAFFGESCGGVRSGEPVTMDMVCPE